MKQELQIQYLKVAFTSFMITIWIKGQKSYLILLWQKKKFHLWFSNYTEIKRKSVHNFYMIVIVVEANYSVGSHVM